MVKEFMYTSHNGTKLRKVFVIRENAHYIEGIDLSLVSENDAKTITTKYKDVHPVSSRDEKVMLDDFNPAWNKAYRQFAKHKITV